MKKIQISETDFKKLQDFLERERPMNAEEKSCREALLGELNRAEIVQESELAPDVITLGRRATLTDLEANDNLEYTLVMPDAADISAGRISILAPLGTAMLGFRLGDEFEWTMPGGKLKLRVARVEPAHDLD